jgi:N-acetylglucosaminyl-diphospho-decaprenol L-rhamnosyltransferase
MNTCATNNKLCISIVSHGHKKLVYELVNQLVAEVHSKIAQVIITCNRPDLESFEYLCSKTNPSFILRCINNVEPLGFGANHNQAFKYCGSDFFCVLNPDIELKNDTFENIFNMPLKTTTGLAYPLQLNECGALLDFERDLVSPSSIIQRHLLRQRYQSRKRQVDWVSGAFMVFKSSVFRELNGFDERYFMYCEDADICLRLQLAGYTLARADTTVIHHTQRQTLKNPQHLAWHIRSLFRLWNSDAYKAYKRQFIDGHA